MLKSTALHTEVLVSRGEVHIADERDLPGCEIKHSVDSRAGRGFKVADGAQIPNKGEASPQCEVDGEQGQVHELIFSFQVAKVSKPLRSVSMIADAGFDILFAKTHASVKDPKGGRVICTYQRSGDLYVGEMRLKNILHPSFRRQGQ